jgi:hypothetical protein
MDRSNRKVNAWRRVKAKCPVWAWNAAGGRGNRLYIIIKGWE